MNHIVSTSFVILALVWFGATEITPWAWIGVVWALGSAVLMCLTERGFFND